MRKYISEFIGTFLLIFMGCGAAVASNALFSAQGFLPASFGMVIVAVSFGVILAVLTYAFAKVSGAHLNPAVSLAMLVTKKLSVKDFFGYIVSQFAGGIAGAALLIVLLGGRTSLGANGYGSLSTFGITL
ncbi:MAG: MIP/aquaporin family protein, partial [Emergencia sp.]